MQFLLFFICCIVASQTLFGECSEENQSSNLEKLQQHENGSERSQKKEIEPLEIGNFALAISQQPGPLVSFGENIVDKGQTQLFVFADDFYSKKKCTTDVIPSLLYGITDNLSIFLNAPFTPLMKDTSSDSPQSSGTSSPTQPQKGGASSPQSGTGSSSTQSENSHKQAASKSGRSMNQSDSTSEQSHTYRSRGWEDLFIQLEYAVYTMKTLTSVDQATIVANMTFPTGSSKKNPPTGFGASSYFIGGTYSHMTTDWFAFTSHGAVFPTAHHQTKFGEQLLYQFGFGSNIPSPKKWIYAWMVEMNGQYTRKNKIQGVIDPNSGGNTIFVTPSLWVSSERIILQFGVGVPIVQHLFGEQRKYHYSLVCNLGYTF